MKTIVAILLSLTSALIASASSTQIWEQKTVDDFEKGEASGTAITSDGRLQLSPRMDTVYETGDPYVWALARDSRGRVFVAGGNEGKVYAVGGSGAAASGSLFFKAREIEVHALAVDSSDNLYAGSSPDGKVYKVTPDGNSSVFFEPKVKYIWALALDRKGNLYVATGDRGELFKVDQQGKGSVVYKSGDKHIRSLAAYGADAMIAGTEGRGRIVRVSADGQAFVMFDAGVREITSVAVAEDGVIFAAGIGAGAGIPGRTPASPAISDISTILERVGAVNVSDGPPAPAAVGREAQSSEVYRIAQDGYPKRIWKSDRVTAFCVVPGPNGSALVGTGDRGSVYGVSEDSRGATVLTRTGGSQVTALLADAASKSFYAATSNLGRLFRIGSGYALEGKFESQVKDAVIFSKWGRLRWRQDAPAGTAVKIRTRSGNTREPDTTWSPWSDPLTSSSGQQVSSPAARFFQWQAVFSTTRPDATPVVDNVELAYLTRNVAPDINSVTLQQRDMAIERLPILQDQQSMTQFSAISQTQPNVTGSSSSVPLTQPARPVPSRTSIRKGWQAVTWDARDENGDTLQYAVYIKGEGESDWKLLKERIEEPFYSWDTTNFPDGAYTVRLVATDLASNPPELSLQTSRISERFFIDNTAPAITGLTASAMSGGQVKIRFRATDSATWLSKAEYGVNGGDLRQMFPVDGIFDSETEDFEITISGLTPGECTVVVKVADRAGNQSSAKQLIAVK